MDFAMQKAIQNGLINDETWDKGLIEIYEALANDFAYAEPHRLMAFLDNHDMDRAFHNTKKTPIAFYGFNYPFNTSTCATNLLWN